MVSDAITGADFYWMRNCSAWSTGLRPRCPRCSCGGCSSLEVAKVKEHSKGESLFGRFNGLSEEEKRWLFSLYHVRTHSTTAHKPRRCPCEEPVRQSWTSAPRSIRDKFLMLKPSCRVLGFCSLCRLVHDTYSKYLKYKTTPQRSVKRKSACLN